MKDILNFENLSTQIVFQNQTQEEEVFHQEDLIQLFPYGLSVATEVSRPFLLLKDQGHQYTLPVAISPIEAGVALSQTNKSITPLSPHRFSSLLLQSLGMEIKQAVFVEIKGSSQYLRLYMSGHPDMSSMKLRAEEAMSLCIYLNVPIFATREFISRSRVMSAELEKAAQRFQGPSGGGGLVAGKISYLN
jgi:bifunctional DNase/RNase